MESTLMINFSYNFHAHEHVAQVIGGGLDHSTDGQQSKMPGTAGCCTLEGGVDTTIYIIQHWIIARKKLPKYELRNPSHVYLAFACFWIGL